ncbi:hypothetical protein VNO77_20432 [Canavalia gladiata]|uniref:Uncharacterized protein n=1 Tax=Canavalia gladiata TaxID=3824 RepID=A0AAN9LP78_CANGL
MIMVLCSPGLLQNQKQNFKLNTSLPLIMQRDQERIFRLTLWLLRPIISKLITRIPINELGLAWNLPQQCQVERLTEHKATDVYPDHLSALTISQPPDPCC